MNSDLKIDDTVMLDGDKTKWEIGTVGNPRNENPVNMIGRITSIDNKWIIVLWDNGKRNDYSVDDDDLILVERQNDSES